MWVGCACPFPPFPTVSSSASFHPAEFLFYHRSQIRLLSSMKNTSASAPRRTGASGSYPPAAEGGATRQGGIIREETVGLQD